MRLVWTMVAALALAYPACAQDGGDEPPPEEMPPDEKPPDENPPPDEPPPDEVPPDDGVDPELADAEKARLKLLEKDARRLADELKKRMDAAKTDAERSTAIGDVAGRAVIHPILAKAFLPYINPKPISKTLKYDQSVQSAAVQALTLFPFDEVYYGTMKFIKENNTDDEYVRRMLPIFGGIKRPKSIPELMKMVRDKREAYLERAKLAADQLGKIGHRDAIPDLIKELEEQDKAGRADVKAAKRREALNSIVNNALQTITGQAQIKHAAGWRQWWNENMDTFQKPPKAPENGGSDENGG